MQSVLVLEQLFFPVHKPENYVSGDHGKDAAYGHVKRERRKINRAVTLIKEI